jgi:hypothetical protein
MPGFHGVAEMLGLLDLKGGKIVEFRLYWPAAVWHLKDETVKTIGGH